MRGQIQPWFNILDFKTLESMMCLALELKEDVCFSFSLAVSNYQQNLNCCIFGHLYSKFVSPRVPESFSWPLVLSLQSTEVRNMFIWTTLDTVSFWFPFHTSAMREIIFTCPSHGTSVCILLTLTQEVSLPSQPRSAPAQQLGQAGGSSTHLFSGFDKSDSQPGSCPSQRWKSDE